MLLTDCLEFIKFAKEMTVHTSVTYAKRLDPLHVPLSILCSTHLDQPGLCISGTRPVKHIFKHTKSGREPNTLAIDSGLHSAGCVQVLGSDRLHLLGTILSLTGPFTKHWQVVG
jgi:hypothetical protein